MTIQFKRRDGLFSLLAGYSPKARREKLLSTLQAYIDDSRKDIGQKALFLAGCINSADSWMAFSDAWAEAWTKAHRLNTCTW